MAQSSICCLKKREKNIKRNFLSDSLLKNMSATTAISRQIQVQSDFFLPLRKFKVFLDLISEQIQAFRYLISSSISANNALLRLLVKKRKWSLNFPKSSISQRAFKGFYPVGPIGNRNHGIVHDFAIFDCSTGHCQLKTCLYWTYWNETCWTLRICGYKTI